SMRNEDLVARLKSLASWAIDVDHKIAEGPVLLNASERINELAKSKTWQPIERAPKDGTKIDVLVGGQKRYIDCFWHEGEKDFCIMRPDQYGTMRPSRVSCMILGNATHFMHSPKPPAQQVHPTKAGK